MNDGGSGLFISGAGTAAHNAAFYANTSQTTNYDNTAGAVNAGWNGSTVNVNNNIFDGNFSNSGDGGIDNGGGGTVNSNATTCFGITTATAKAAHRL